MKLVCGMFPYFFIFFFSRDTGSCGTSASLIAEPTLKSHPPYQYTSYVIWADVE